MIKSPRAMLNAMALFALVEGCAMACTGFAIRDGKRVLVGFSYDHQFGSGHIYVNKRNVERRRYLLLAEKPLRWVSKYGNVTFNLVSRDYPHDGMNEAGLVVLSMGLDGTRFPAPDDRFALDELGWVQYQLDTAATVEDVIEAMRKVRISSRSIGDSHFLIVDRSGKAAVIEYVDRQTRIYRGDDLPWPILANDTYANMLADLKQQKAFGGSREDQYRVGSSCRRFAHVAEAIRNSPPKGPGTDYPFTILSEVRQSNSQYQVVYDTLNRNIYYRSLNSTDVKLIHLGETDFDCATPALMTEIQSSEKGNLRRSFYAYDVARSRETLGEFNKETFGYLPVEALDSLAETPRQSRCLGKTEQTPTPGAVASLEPPAERRVVVSNRPANIILDFAVKLDRPASTDLEFAFEIPNDSTLVPGDNVFIAPNPVKIERGRRSVGAKVIIIASRVEAGADATLTVNLVSQDTPLSRERRFAIAITSNSTSQ
jgi:penicillin V acylase-like amidase (Ntn superfamily)